MTNIHVDYVQQFIEKFGFDQGFDSLEKLDFAISLITEEYNELLKAREEKDPEELIDALGDMSWLIDKLMLQLNVDPERVRSEIARANLSKERGVKPTRPNSGGFDVIKPEGWVGPDHSQNHGKLDGILRETV